MTISDDLRVIASGIYHDEDQLYAAADRLDHLEAQNSKLMQALVLAYEKVDATAVALWELIPDGDGAS